MGQLVSDTARAQRIREAMAGVAEEMIALGPLRSGHVLVHFQNGVPQKVEWRLVARPIQQPGLTGTDDP